MHQEREEGKEIAPFRRGGSTSGQSSGTPTPRGGTPRRESMVHMQSVSVHASSSSSKHTSTNIFSSQTLHAFLCSNAERRSCHGRYCLITHISSFSCCCMHLRRIATILLHADPPLSHPALFSHHFRVLYSSCSDFLRRPQRLSMTAAAKAFLLAEHKAKEDSASEHSSPRSSPRQHSPSGFASYFPSAWSVSAKLP